MQCPREFPLPHRPPDRQKLQLPTTGTDQLDSWMEFIARAPHPVLRLWAECCHQYPDARLGRRQTMLFTHTYCPLFVWLCTYLLLLLLPPVCQGWSIRPLQSSSVCGFTRCFRLCTQIDRDYFRQRAHIIECFHFHMSVLVCVYLWTEMILTQPPPCSTTTTVAHRTP